MHYEDASRVRELENMLRRTIDRIEAVPSEQRAPNDTALLADAYEALAGKGRYGLPPVRVKSRT